MSSTHPEHIRSAKTTTVDLNTVEAKNLYDFAVKHEDCKKGNHGFPPRLNIQSRPNGIASSIDVECSVCKATESISDIESW